MKVIARSLVVFFVALIAVPVLAVTQTVTTAVQLLATTALIMGGTQHPLSLPTDSNDFVTTYMNQAVNNVIDPDGAPVPANPMGINRVAVIYPAEFFPVFGSATLDASVDAGRLNLGRCLGVTDGECNYNAGVGSNAPKPAVDSFKVFGLSQSALVVSLVKADLIEEFADNPDDAPDAEFFLDANPMRPNGGILAIGFEGLTIPILGITFYGPTPNSCPSAAACTGDGVYTTKDAVQQYDLLGGDAPVVPYNILAWVNSALAYALLHGQVPTYSLDPQVNPIIDQGVYGDTQYYMFGARRLPLLIPLEMAGVPGPLLALVDAPLRVMVETVHYHDVSPGKHVGLQLLPSSDPITFVINLAGSIPVGIDDALQEAGIGRVLGTPDVWRPFGVGGQTYDKKTGEPIEDANLNNATLSFAREGDSEPEAPPAPEGPPAPEKPLAPEPPETGGTQQIDNDSVADEQGNQVDGTADDADADGTKPPAGTNPRPLRDLLRGPIEFDPPKRQNAVRSNGGGPLKRIVNALTGQRPKPAAEPEPGDEPEQKEQPAA